MLTVLYFAWLRDRIGTAEEQLDPPASVTTTSTLVAWLATRSPGHAAAFAHPDRIRCAVNQHFGTDTTPVGPTDEVAFFPPVTGG